MDPIEIDKLNEVEIIPDEKFNSTQYDFDIYDTEEDEDDTLEVDGE